MPALYIAQEEHGWLAQYEIDGVAGVLGLTSTEVGSVASFYTMYYLRPVGHHVIEFCTDLPCALVGADQAYDRLCARLGLRPGEETTADDSVTLRESPCLGGCDRAPVLLLDNSTECDRMTDQKTEALLSQLHVLERGVEI